MYEDNKKDDDKKYYNESDLVVDATPTVDNGPPIPPGHRRFYCEKCRAVRTSTWRRDGITGWLCRLHSIALRATCCVFVFVPFGFLKKDAVQSLLGYYHGRIFSRKALFCISMRLWSILNLWSKQRDSGVIHSGFVAQEFRKPFVDSRTKSSPAPSTYCFLAISIFMVFSHVCLHYNSWFWIPFGHSLLHWKQFPSILRCALTNYVYTTPR